MLAIVVFSILCLLFDNGGQKYELQYKSENTPVSWYSECNYVKEMDIFVENLTLTFSANV